MTKDEVARLDEMRIDGLTPVAIAAKLDMPISTVTSHIRRHPVPEGTVVCKQCGSLIKVEKGKKTRKFCSNECKVAWWNRHRYERKDNLITRKCTYCGKEFSCYESENRKYCSSECYHNARRTEAV